MNDFNFFSPYLQKKRNIRQRKLFIIAVSTLAIVALLSFTSLNIYQIIRYRNEISTVESYMNSSKTIEMIGKYTDTTKKLAITEEYFVKASEAAKFVKGSNTVSTKLLEQLSSVMPQDAVMTNLAINNNIVEIKYNIKNMTSVAEIEHNLKLLGIFDMVHVNTIDNGTSFTANISCSLKDVDRIEAQTNK